MKYTAAAAACLGALGFCVWWLVHPATWHGPAAWYVLMAASWLLFAGGAWLIRKAPRKHAVALILVGAAGLPLAAGFAPPRSSDDLYRYIWDGRVQAEGVSPYTYAPAAPELARLRDDFLWPTESPWCVSPETPGAVPGCSLINRPTVPTIYPPAAQAYFLAVQALSPPGTRERPVQFSAALAVLAIAALLVWLLPKAGADPRTAALWAWCPLVALEAGNNAHLDVVSTLFAVAALLAAALAKTWRGTAAAGMLIGLAVATKFTPALTGPSLVRRRPLIVAATAALTVTLLYVPHVLANGSKALGYLPDYLVGEGYDTGTRFALLALVLPPSASLAAAAAILLGTAALAWWRTNPDRPWHTATIMTGTFLLVATPGYSWYTILLIALAAMSDRPEWIAIGVAGYVAQYSSNLQLDGFGALQLGYGSALLIVVAVTTLRHTTSRRPAVA